MESSKPAKVIKNVVEAAAEKVSDLISPDVSGAPGRRRLPNTRAPFSPYPLNSSR